MKKALTILATLLCLCLLVGCEAQQLLSEFGRLSDVAEQLAENNDAMNAVVDAVQNYVDASDTDAAPTPTPAPAQAPAATAAPTAEAAPTPTAVPARDEAVDAFELPEEDAYQGAPQNASPADASVPAPTPTQAPAQTDFTALSADQCVTDQDGLPHITLDCGGARSINEDVEGMFRYLVGSDACTLYYEYYKNAGRVLSVLVVQLYDGDASYFTPFNLDLATGRRISGGELLSLLGAGADALADQELQLMGAEFEYEYGGMKDGELAGFYEEQYERTISPDNADTERVWLGSDGRLNFVAKIFALAGAEYYEYPMDTGLRY